MDRTMTSRTAITSATAVGLLLLLLTGCAGPSEQEQAMTPTESRETMLTLLASSRDATGIPAAEWSEPIDIQSDMAADPCAMSNGDTGVNFSTGRSWEGDTSDDGEMEAVVQRVRDHWESNGMTTVRKVSPGPKQIVRLIGEGADEVRSIRTTIIPGKITISAESVCVVGNSAELNLNE